MKHSFLLRRIFLIAIIAIVAMIVLSSVAYTVLAKTVFTKLREDELLPRARALSRIVAQYMAGDEEQDEPHALEALTRNSGDILGAYVLAMDSEGRPVFSYGQTDTTHTDLLQNALGDILAGQTVRTPRVLRFVTANVIFVGVPIRSEEGDVIGALVMLIPMVEVIASVTSMYSALLLSLVIVLPLVGIGAYFLAEHVSRPLRQMNDAALAIAGGNFTVRADPEQGGEIGELGRSLNFLARELSGTIDALTLERNRLHDIIDGLQEGIVAVDRDGNVTHVNTALSEIFAKNKALSDGSLNSRRLEMIPFPEIWEDFGAVLEGKGVEQRQIRFSERVLRSRITPIYDDNGAIAGAVCMLTDITQEELLETTRREYVANVSHELRTPLTAMRGLVEPMRDGLVKSEETRMRYFDIILRETMRLSRLIDDLMELSRLQSGTLAMECGPVNTTVMLTDLQDKYTSIAEDHDITFRLACDPEKCPYVHSNADRMEEVLVILLDNAIKYTPEGGTVTLDAQVAGGKMHISVADTGIGISEEDCEHIFDRFYKVDKAHTSKGSGLGLSIAHEILERLGSRLTVESKVGQGSVFRFDLPISYGE